MYYLLVALASICFGFFPSVQNQLLLDGITPMALVVLGNGFCALFALIFCLITRQSIKANKKQILHALLTGVGLLMTNFLLNVAYTMIPIGFATMIHFMFPTVVCVIMVLFFGKKFSLLKLITIVAAIGGMACLAGGGFSGRLLGILVALCTAFTYAYYMISNDLSSLGELPPMTRCFYVNVFVTVIAFACSPFMKMTYPTHAGQWGWALLMGILLCTGYFLLNLGIDHMGSGVASFINMVEPLTSLIVSSLLYHYQITLISGLGCVLIICSLIFTALEDQRSEKAKPAC